MIEEKMFEDEDLMFLILMDILERIKYV